MVLHHIRSKSLTLAAAVSSLLAIAVFSCTEWESQNAPRARTLQRTGCVPRVSLAGGGAGQAVGASAGQAGSGGAGQQDAGLGEAGAPAAGSGSDLDSGSVGPHVERAILVSIDGLGGKYLETQFAKQKLSMFQALRSAGSSTLNARADYEFTITLPNHTSMLTGRPVSRDPDLPADVHHGIMINGLVDSTYTIHNGGNPALKYISSVFDVAHDHGKKTCMYAGKLKFMLFANSYNEKNGAPDTVGEDNGRNKIDRVVILENNTEQLITAAETDLASGACDFAFIHIADMDTPLGHSYGWGSVEWYAGLDLVDAWIGRLMKFALPNDAGATFGLVVTADHGGDDGHGDPTALWTYQIPFFAVGPSFTPGTDLYAIANKGRCDPGLVRPRYSVTLQPVRNADAANVILTMLGLPQVPGSYMRDLLGPR